MKTKVVHSQSKNAWNVVGELIGDKYKIARIPYIQCDNDILNTKWKHEALEIAMHISKSMETFKTNKPKDIFDEGREPNEALKKAAEKLKCYHENHEWQSDGDGGNLKYCNDCKGYV